MPEFPVPCRLYVILAREAPVGVIFRCGPSKWTQIIQWNTDSDTLEEGAWFHGQMYPQRGDISPDGTKLIYFATNYDATDNDFPAEWTAISKMPWLTALCAWPNLGTYFGGGLFATDSKIWLNQNFHYHGNMTDGSVLPQDIEISSDWRCCTNQVSRAVRRVQVG